MKTYESGNILKRFTPVKMFFTVSLIGIIAFLIFALCNNSMSTFDWLIMQHNSDYTFADFFYHIFYGRDLKTVYNAYDVDPCFPPLSYLFYHYVFKAAPVDNMERLKDVAFYPYYSFIYMIIASVLIVLFSFSVQIFNERQEKPFSTYKVMLLVVIAVMSVPFGASALERGNSVFPVLILLIFAYVFKDSDNKIMRELALIFVAVAANLKLYPAIFGLLYLKEKRFKEAFRLIIYGVVLFLFPFVFFDGLKSIKDYLIILRLMMGRSSEQSTTVRGLVTMITEGILGAEYKWTGHTVGEIAENIYLVAAMAAFYVSREKWKEIFLLLSPMVVYVASAYRYTSIYFFLALLIFLISRDDSSTNSAYGRGNKSIRDKMDYVYAFLFGMIFTVPIWVYRFELENFMYLCIYLMLIMLIVDAFVCFYKERRSAKMN